MSRYNYDFNIVLFQFKLQYAYSKKLSWIGGIKKRFTHAYSNSKRLGPNKIQKTLNILQNLRLMSLKRNLAVTK